MLRDRADIVFLMVGDGAERDRLARRRKELGLSNVVMLGQQPKERMPQLWTTADVSLVLLRDTPLFRTVIPSKIFESLAMRTPVVLGVEGHALLAIVVTSALPTAQNIFVHATRYDRAPTLARDTILVTTVGAVPLITLVVWLLG